MRKNIRVFAALVSSLFLLAVGLLGFQNCSGFSASPDFVGLASSAANPKFDAYRTRAESSFIGTLQTLGVNTNVQLSRSFTMPASFGTAHASARYNPHGTVQTSFVDGAIDAYNLGFQTLKIWIGPEITNPSFYFLQGDEISRYTDFSSALDFAAYKAVLAVPFQTVVFEADDQALWSMWNTPLSQEAKDRIYRTTYNFALRLRKDFAGSGRTFVFQNHEGDWHIDSDPTNVSLAHNPTPVGLTNFKDYWTIRQKAVEDARAASSSSDVGVYQLCEVVRVTPSLKDSSVPSLTRDVLPQVACDLVGYSSYDSALDSASSGSDLFERAFAYIKSKALPSPTFGTNQVVVSEMGLPEQNSTFSMDAKNRMGDLVVSLVNRGVPYVLTWTLYDNECNLPACNTSGGVTQNVPVENLSGYWIRKPDGSFGAVYSRIASKLQQSVTPLPSVTPQQIPPQNSADAYDIIVIAGQSNAAGSGLGPISDDHSADGRIYQLGLYGSHKNQIIPGSDYMEQRTNDHIDDPGAPNTVWAGFAMSFAREYAKSAPNRKILIINGSLGGSSILQWSTTGVLYTQLRDRVRLGLSLNSGNKVAAFLWHQGETDIGNIRAQNPLMSSVAMYTSNLQALWDAAHADFMGQAPFLIGDFVPSWESSAPEKFAFRAGLRDFVRSKAQTYFVSSFGLLSNLEAGASTDPGQYIHFAGSANIEFGKRYYTVMLQRRDGPASLLDEDLTARINHIYLDTLGRSGDTAGLRFWLIALQDHSSFEEIRSTFAHSAECTSAVDALYRQILGRPVDSARLAFWQDAIAKNATLAMLRDYLYGSDEYRQHTAGSTTTTTTTSTPTPTPSPSPSPSPDSGISSATLAKAQSYVDALYLSVLKRSSDPSGKDSWTSEYTSGRLHCVSLTRAFLVSDEAKTYQNSLGNADFVSYLYPAAFGRQGESGGIDSWTNDLNSGGHSRNQLIDLFSSSNEVVSRCTNAGLIP